MKSRMDPILKRSGQYWLTGSVLTILFSIQIVSCSHNDHARGDQKMVREKAQAMEKSIPFCYESVDELKRGDIIVKPNMNILPGSSRVPDGYFFGHAALVVVGAKDSNPDTMLAHARIVESIATDVPKGFQIREAPGYYRSEKPYLNSTKFDPVFKGRRYRLRLDLTDAQVDSIIAFAGRQKNDLSSWNATKSFPGDPFNETLIRKGLRENWADNETWYCSLLIWQAVYFVTGLDLDPNGGFEVYPNDLINSPRFDNLPDGKQHRARF